VIDIKNIHALVNKLFEQVSTQETPASTIEQDKVKAHITQLDFMIGTWTIKNKLRQPDGSIIERTFLVNSSYTFNGLAIESHWQDILPPNEYVGTVFHTYDPKSEHITISFYNAENTTWSQNSQQMLIKQSEIISTFKGKDSHGDFQSKTVISINSKDQHTHEIKRLYTGLKEWMLIDFYIANRIDLKE